MRTFRSAWRDALYGPEGFYRKGFGPGRDFATPSSAPFFVDDVALPLAVRLAAELGAGPFQVVDVGAGDGALLTRFAALAPRHWQLVGVEVRPRPPDLPARVAWRRRLPEGVVGLLLAVEWLDAVPCEVVREGALVLADGSAGPPPGAADAAWLDRWWPHWWLETAEVGRYRDLAWSAARSHLRAGLALAIDYGHQRDRRRATLTGYRGGRQVPVRLDGSTDITAHVALDSLAAAPGAGPGVLHRQREVLRGLGMDGRLGPGASPAALHRAAAHARLLDPDGFGGFCWVQHRVELPGRPGAVTCRCRR